MTDVIDDTSQPEVALALAAAGMYVFPADHPGLPICAGPKSPTHDPATCPPDQRGKHPAVKWDTGASTSVHNIHHWWSGNPRNIGIHCGKSGFLVVDEDAPAELAKFAADHGVEIPETYTVTTAKGKHYYFKDTEGGDLGNREGAFGDYAINIRSGNGYVVGPGSMHATGVVYTADGHTIAPLPPWIPEAIRGGRQQQTNGTPTTAEVLNGQRQGFVLPDVIKDGHRHNTLVKYASSLLARDCPLSEAKILFENAWQRCEQPPAARTPITLEEAYAKLEDVYQRYPAGRSEGYQKQVGPLPGSAATPAAGLNLPEEFRNARPVLQHIRQAAHSRGRSADAVLYATLARISAMVSPLLQLENCLGEGSLNMFTAMIGKSGRGKSRAARLAKTLIRTPVSLANPEAFRDSIGLGSGEGLAELFMGWTFEPDYARAAKKDGTQPLKRVKKKLRDNAFVYVDEGQTLSQQGRRQGNIVLPTIRSAWIGESLGQANASDETTRHVPEGSYSLGLIIGYQKDTAQELLSDVAAGTPQRFIMCSATDPTVPLAPPDHPGHLDTDLDGVAGKITFYREINDELWQQNYAKVTGAEEDDAELDSHEPLMLSKLSALLCLLEGRRVVTLDDWALAKIMYATSRAVMDDLVTYGQEKAQDKADAHADLHATREARGYLAKKNADENVSRIAKLT